MEHEYTPGHSVAKFMHRRDIASDVKGVGDDLKSHMTDQTGDIKKHVHDTVSAAVRDITQQLTGSSASVEQHSDLDSWSDDVKVDAKKADDVKADDVKADDVKADKAHTPQQQSGKGKGTCGCPTCRYLKDIADTFDDDLPEQEALLCEDLRHPRSGKGASSDLQRIHHELCQVSVDRAEQDFMRSSGFMQGAACMHDVTKSCYNLWRSCAGDKHRL